MRWCDPISMVMYYFVASFPHALQSKRATAIAVDGLNAVGCNKIKYCQPFDAIWSISCGDKVTGINATMLCFFFCEKLQDQMMTEQWAHRRTHEATFNIFFASAKTTSNTFFSFHFEFLSHSTYECFSCTHVCVRLSLHETIRSLSRHEFAFDSFRYILQRKTVT